MLMSIQYCCPVCGAHSSDLIKDTHCFWCGKCFANIDLYIAKYSIDYYCEEAKKRFPPDEVGYLGERGEYRWGEILLEEVAQNPLFDKKLSESIRKKKQEEWESRPAYVPPKNSLVSNLPKCPTCGSTNLEKISDIKKGVHAVAFGIFSKTAFSQYKCRNCGYKW